MADEIDQAQAYSEAELARNLAAVRAQAAIPEGHAGDCDFCGEWTGRLVGGACAPVPRREAAAMNDPIGTLLALIFFALLVWVIHAILTFPTYKALL